MSVENPKNLFEGDEWILPTDIELLQPARFAIRQRLAEAGWSDDDTGWLEDVFGEMLVNAIVHGNLAINQKSEEESWYVAAKKEQEKHPTDKKVTVKLDITPDEAVITIRDEGSGFDWKNQISYASEDVLKTSGRGSAYLGLIDSFQYNEKGNEVTLKKKRSLGPK